VLFRAPDGRIWIFHTSQRAGHDQTKALILGLSSSDEGHTWGDPVTIFSQPGLYLRQPPVAFHGQWVLPVYHSAGGSNTNIQSGGWDLLDSTDCNHYGCDTGHDPLLLDPCGANNQFHAVQRSGKKRAIRVDLVSLVAGRCHSWLSIARQPSPTHSSPSM
jgi:hypothetical protein